MPIVAIVFCQKLKDFVSPYPNIRHHCVSNPDLKGFRFIIKVILEKVSFCIILSWDPDITRKQQGLVVQEKFKSLELCPFYESSRLYFTTRMHFVKFQEYNIIRRAKGDTRSNKCLDCSISLHRVLQKMLESHIQLQKMNVIPLVNKPYVNEVTSDKQYLR